MSSYWPIVEGRCSIFSIMFSLVAKFFIFLLKRIAKSMVKMFHDSVLRLNRSAAILPNNYEQSNIVDCTSSPANHRCISEHLKALCGNWLSSFSSLTIFKKINKMCWSIQSTKYTPCQCLQLLQWRLGVSGAISYDQVARQGIDRWPVVNATANHFTEQKLWADCAALYESMTCLRSVNLNYCFNLLKIETGMSYLSSGLMLLY